MNRGCALVSRDSLLAPPDVVARQLLGKRLIRTWQGETLAGRIVETEAYFGADDPAAHASAGRTPRNEVLWGPPGHAYVYLIYGLHSCLNVSCEPEGAAGCVLIRALEPLNGRATMARLRGLPQGAAHRLLASGPGRLCQALGITRSGLNGADLLEAAGALQLAEAEPGFVAAEILATPRIGITKAAERPLRFLLAGDPCVSGRRIKTV